MSFRCSSRSGSRELRWHRYLPVRYHRAMPILWFRREFFSCRAQVFLLLLVGLTPVVHAEWFGETQAKMGTRVEVQFWHADADQAASLMKAAMAEIDRIEQEMSTFRESSPISAVNREAAVRPVPVSTELFGLVERALELSELTNGAFDITFDSVGQLYDFRSGRRPDGEEIAARLGSIDYHQVHLLAKQHAVRFLHPGVRINLGGIAKGYTVESVIGLLRKAGVKHALATAGGDTRLLGDRRGRPWTVGIRNPDDKRGLVTRLALADEAISTSGDYERFFIEDGVRYHHILDPATGHSAGALRSATVIGPDATMTD
ncbi:MAG TPA: FAD:protein FMN transferase, partial [Chromatiales bacterium]|nr:FAD:protein FMN transferase [Chromatiales bacterium]